MSLKRRMTEKARKFAKWNEAGGKFPAGIISDEYKKALQKQRLMQPAGRKSGEDLETYRARRKKVMDQKARAKALLELL